MPDRFSKLTEEFFRDFFNPKSPIADLFRDVNEFLNRVSPKPEEVSSEPSIPKSEPRDRSLLADVIAERDNLRQQIEVLVAERNAWRQAYRSLAAVIDSVRTKLNDARFEVKPEDR